MPAPSTDEKEPTAAGPGPGPVHELELHCLKVGWPNVYTIRLPGDGSQSVAVLKSAIAKRMRRYLCDAFELYMAKQEGRPDAPWIASNGADFTALTSRRLSTTPFPSSPSSST